MEEDRVVPDIRSPSYGGINEESSLFEFWSEDTKQHQKKLSSMKMEDLKDLDVTCDCHLSKDCQSNSNQCPVTKIKRLRANDRERRRVHLINSAMNALKSVVPGLREKRKITKLELLRCANRYIWMLDQSLKTGRSLEELQQLQCYYPHNLSPLPTMMHFGHQPDLRYHYMRSQYS